MVRSVSLTSWLLLFGAFSSVAAVPGFRWLPYNQEETIDTSKLRTNHGSKHENGGNGASHHSEVPPEGGDNTWEPEDWDSEGHSLGCATMPPDPKQLAQEAKQLKYLKGQNSRNHGTQWSPPAYKEIQIPLHYHIIYADETQAGGYLRPWQIEQSMYRLNLDLAGSGVRFTLASTSYIHNPTWFNTGVGNNYAYERGQMASLRIGDEKVLNVYTVGWGPGRSGAYGYAHYPSHYSTDPGWDGILLNHVTMPGGSEEAHNLGRILVHEVGHWSGLIHTFDGYSCDGPGDYVDDTPQHIAPSWQCEVPMDTCPGQTGADPVFNFMNYAVRDYCYSEFTPGQKERMRLQLLAYRGWEMY